MTRWKRRSRRRMWFMIVTGAAVSGAIAGAGAWRRRAGRSKRDDRAEAE